MQTTRCVHALVERSKHHGEHSAEGSVKPADRIGKGVRMPFDRSGDPRVRKLQQQGTAGAEENRALAIDLPGE
jgi:hypothetical protein